MAEVRCNLCGARPQGDPDAVPLTWVHSVENGVSVYYCDLCSREHLRSIEAKLDSQHW